MKKILTWTFVAAACIGVVACNLLPFGNGQTGSVKVDISNGLQARTVTSDLDMTIDSYAITLSGPGTTTSTTLSGSETSTTFSSLTPGTWSITVDAKNPAASGAEIIGTGTASTTVVGGQTATADITVVPLSGQGTFTLSMSWPASAVSTPSVQATLTPVGGSANDFSADVTVDKGSDPYTASYSGTWDAGYYTLKLELQDSGSPVWDWVDTVQIVKGHTSNAVYTLTAADINATGSLQLAIAPDLQQPIPITLSGASGVVGLGDEMTVTANPTVTPDSYAWYLNGKVQAGQTGSSITIGSGLAVGVYTLNVVVQKATATATVLSSKGVRFSVLTDVPYSWTKAAENPVIDIGASGSFDDLQVESPIVLQVAGGYRMYYFGVRGTYDYHVGMATSVDGSTWTKATPNPVFGADGEYAIVRALGSVIQDAEGYKMYYTRYPAYYTGNFVFLATSTDGLNWTEYSGSQSYGSVLLPSIASQGAYQYNIAKPIVIYDSDDSLYKMWYGQSVRTSSSDPNGYRIDYATSSDGRNWTKYASNPVLSPGAAGAWDEHSVLPSSVVKVSANEYRMFYYSNYHIGLAESTDGINWTKSSSNPILAPGSAGSWDSASVAAGSVTPIGNDYRMYYQGSDGTNARIGYAVRAAQ